MGENKKTEVFFEFPESPIKGIPLTSEDNNLSFGFIEIGCKSGGKRSQLKNKKELFYKYWGDLYRDKLGVEWEPQIYRTLAFYNPDNVPRLDVPKYELDVRVFYEYITSGMIESLTEKEKLQIFSQVIEKRRSILEEIIETKDSEKLHDFIINHQGKQLSNGLLRGKIAEILALKDFESVLPAGVNLYRNGDIKYFNSRYSNGTEIDGILTLYSEEKFLHMVGKLHEKNHLKIKDRWH